MQVGWPNIGPVAAGPAGPVPMALIYCILVSDQGLFLKFMQAGGYYIISSSQKNWFQDS